ncbi:MAG: AI-2E family transporter [Proteobacteria bacterium]|nr:AI-2E family transporter [Pseudomonadota bacterium]
MSEARLAGLWLGALLAVAGLLYLLRGVLAPFVAGAAIAYLLDPAAERMGRLGVARAPAAGLLIVLALVGLALALALLVPLVEAQAAGFLARLPGYAEALIARLAPIAEALRTGESAKEIGQAAAGYAGTLIAWAGRAAGEVVSGGLAVLNLLSLLLITPIVAFYLLKDWDRLLAAIDDWLPRAAAPAVRAQAREIDRVLSAWLRGQLLVCLILGLFYGVGLSLIGLDLGLVVGLAAGALSFIPFVGVILGAVLGIGLALGQFAEWWPIAGVGAIFAAGQVVEGHVLTPRLVGERVGLHAVWVIFALLAGGALFGFVGVLLAVPAAAAIGVLARFALARYRASPLYLGRRAGPESGPDRGPER